MSFWDKLTKRPNKVTANPKWTEFSAKLEEIRAACTLQWTTDVEARNTLAVLRLREHSLHLLKSDIRHRMQQIRQDYTTSRAEVKNDLFIDNSSKRENAQQKLTRKEIKVLESYEQDERAVDQLIQSVEHTKLDIYRWIADHI
jgi:phage shock protein A